MKYMSILLQRNDLSVPWGFEVTGGDGLPVTVCKVIPGTLGRQHLDVGDVILEMEGQTASDLPEVKVIEMIDQSGDRLELLVAKPHPRDRQDLLQFIQQKTSASASKGSPGPLLSNGTHSAVASNGAHSTVASNGTATVPHANGGTNGTVKTNGFPKANGVSAADENGGASGNASASSAQTNGAGTNGTVKTNGAGTNGTVKTNGAGTNGTMKRTGAPPPPPLPPFGGFGGRVPPPPPLPPFGGFGGPFQMAPREAPAVIQNAMATKDKKPFSYLPVGGIDLSEVKGHPIHQRAPGVTDGGQDHGGQTQQISAPMRASAAQSHMVPVAQPQSLPANTSSNIGNVGGSNAPSTKPPSIGSAWEQNLARQRNAAPPGLPFGEKVALSSVIKGPSPPRSVTDAPPPASTVAMAANPPWRVTRKPSVPGLSAKANFTDTKSKDTTDKATRPVPNQSSPPSNQAATSGQARGQLYIPPVSKAEPVAEALASPPTQKRNTPPSWQRSQLDSNTKATVESPLASKRDDANAPQWRMARQLQKQASKPSGMLAEEPGRNSSGQNQPQLAQHSLRQTSLSSERTIPVQLVSGPDGQPHISIGGRLIPVTAEGAQLPMGLIMPEVEKGRLIQEVAQRQHNRPTGPTSNAGRPRVIRHDVPKDSVGDPIPTMRSLQLSEEDKRLVSAFREQEDDDQSEAPQENALYKGSHIPSRLFRSLERTVDGETETFLHSECDPRYRGAHIPSKTFRILQQATGEIGVSGGVAPPSRIGGPGQGRAVIVNMNPGRPGGSSATARPDEVPLQKKNPSRSFRVLQQMTAEEQDS